MLEEIKSIDELQHLLRTRYEVVEFLKEYEKNRNSFKWNEQDYIDFIEELKNMLSDYKENK